jgi:hypothetical protein
MLRPLSIAAAGTGVTALVLLACSGSFEPATAIFENPGQAQSSDGPTLTPQVSDSFRSARSTTGWSGPAQGAGRLR